VVSTDHGQKGEVVLEGAPPYILDPELERAIESEFTVEDRYIEYETFAFIVSPRQRSYEPYAVKESFQRIVKVFRAKDYLPFLRREKGRLMIRVFKKSPRGKTSYRLNLLLLALTICTVSYDGYLRSNIPILTKELMPGTPVYVNALLFLASILGIFGLHELSHKFSSTLRGSEASMPYFIPAPPGMGGTFGAVITQKEPPANRDALFDVGLSGPLAGFLATIIVSIIGISISFTVPVSKFAEWRIKYPEVDFVGIPSPPLIEFLILLIKPTPPGYSLIFHPVAFAAWVGCLITFLNLIPSWQLDGGHVVKALLGERLHRILSVIGLAVMFLLGYYTMAILLALLMFRTRAETTLLDDVSPLSLGRKIMSMLYVAMIGLTLVILNPIAL